MQFTTNKRIIDRYLDISSPKYCNYDINTVIMTDYLYKRKLIKPSVFIHRVRMIYDPIMTLVVSRFENRLRVRLSAETFCYFKKTRKEWYGQNYKDSNIPPKEVRKIIKRRRFYVNAIRYCGRRFTYNPKHLDKKTIWLNKHKLI